MRPEADDYFLAMARLVSTRGTCHRRKVGCVLVNSRNHVIATGYNGPPAGASHCEDGNLCPGALAESGTNLDACGALHAEWNALLQCRDVYDIHTVYVTTSPCITCTKLFRNTSARRIVFLELYPGWEKSEAMWPHTWEHHARS